MNQSVYPPVPSLYPVPNYPVPLYYMPYTKRLGKKFAPFAVCSAVRSVPWATVLDGIPVEDSDGIPVELYSFAPTIVTAVVRGEGFTRIDVDTVSLNRVGSPIFFLATAAASSVRAFEPHGSRSISLLSLAVPTPPSSSLARSLSTRRCSFPAAPACRSGRGTRSLLKGLLSWL